jgi:hypothetical protein
VATPNLVDPSGMEINGKNGPWWLKSAWVVGPITLIALGLVYFLAVDVRDEARDAARVGVAIASALAEHQKHTEQLHRNIEDYMRVQNLLTRQLCANSAKSDVERRACFQP